MLLKFLLSGWLVCMIICFLCTHLNLQEDSFTDGSGQNDRLSSTSTESNSSSGSDKLLLPPSGTSSLSADLSHYSRCCVSCVWVNLKLLPYNSPCVHSLYYMNSTIKNRQQKSIRVVPFPVYTMLSPS